MHRVQSGAFRRSRNRWLAHGSELIAPLLRAGASLAVRRAPKPKEEWRRGLILSHTHIGDVLYRTGSMAALRSALPHCEWTYAVSPQSAPILANNPDFAEVLPVVTGEDSWDLARAATDLLRSREFDVVLCTNTLRHYPDLLLATALGIPDRVGFSGKGFSGLMTHRVPLPYPSAYAAYFRAMVAAVTGVSGNWELRPRVFPNDDNRARASAEWDLLGMDGSKPVLACSLRTRQQSGNWPVDVLLSVLESARAQMEMEVVLCGGPADAGFLQQTARSLPFAVHVTAGRLGLLDFAAFLSQCSALLTLDSGPRHIGNAAGVPVVFARNLWHSRVEAGAYCSSETDLAPPTEFLGNDETARVARSQDVNRLASLLLQAIRR